MVENEISGKLVQMFYKIHTTLGPGLFESIYEEVLCYELTKSKINYTRQHPIPVLYDNVQMGIGFRSDVIIENKVIVELKSVEFLAPVHSKQLLTYLKLTDTRLGLLVNFNERFIRNGITRIVNNL